MKSSSAVGILTNDSMDADLQNQLNASFVASDASSNVVPLAKLVVGGIPLLHRFETWKPLLSGFELI